jgi:hypothetical protein
MKTSAKAKTASSDAYPPVSPHVLLLRDELAAGTMKPVAEFALGSLSVDVRAGQESLWAIIRRAKRGGVALRLAHAPGGCGAVSKRRTKPGEPLRFEFESTIGLHRVSLDLWDDPVPLIRAHATLTPHEPLLVPYLPRDVYPLSADDDPLSARGKVEAAQRGMASAVSYFRMEEDFGSTLYFQNLTTLNPWFEATRTKPDGAVGGEWPELGYLPPTPPQSGIPPKDPLPAGQETAVSDAYLAFHEAGENDERAIARRYLSLLGAIYRRLDRPVTDYRDWVDRAERSLRDLAEAPEASIRHYGHRYLHPYTAAEYPDSMVQLSVLSAIRDYEVWSRTKIPIGAELAAGLRKFYDPKLKTLRRYLPNVSKEKDKDAVDSWYLYHPLRNLGRLATDGDRKAERLFRQTIDFGIRAAHHFDYKWPVQYKVTDFSVVTEARDEDGRGQTDVGGFYAYVMLQAFELTDDWRYLDEARAAIDAAKGLGFELNYQANLTAWGAAACLRLWRITNEQDYLQQSYVYLASFFHNTAIWESEIGHARHYRNFLGVTALHDAPYMAIYECFDSFAAFERLLKYSGPDLDPSARLLVSEYCRYALDRAWFFYPDALPQEAISPKQRETNGHVDRKLSFPLEDLYVAGDLAGQVGQEIYGAGAAFVFASRSFHTVGDAPFRIFCDHFLLASERPAERGLSFQLGGGEGMEALLCLIRTGRAKLPDFTVTTLDGEVLRPSRTTPDRIEYRVPADGRIGLRW